MANTTEHQEQPPAVDLFKIISGFWISRAVYIVAKLGLADLMKDGPKSAQELATATGTHAPSLYRVLRALLSVGLLTDENGKFGVTPVTALLATNIPGSLRWFTVSELGEEHYTAWGNLMHSVKTGEIAFDEFYGMDVWEFYNQNPENASIFNDSMSSVTAATNEAICACYDFSPFSKIVDVGGGHAGLITAVLKKHPELTGTVFDSPDVAAGAKAKIESAGLSHRCDAQGGDFFSAVPSGGDAYMLKWILHDWNDELSLRILKNIRKEISSDGKLIVLDAVVPDTPEPDFSKFLDLNMMVMTGGKERTAKEWEELLRPAGFEIQRIIRTETPTCVLEARPV